MAKIALLIGVSDYQSGLTPLPSAVRDVEAMYRVLQNKDMGAFDDVRVLTNPDPLAMQGEIEALFAERDKDDLVLLFFSGHGIKDDSGKLHFATHLTRKTPRGELVRSTAVPSSFVQDIMSNSRSKHQVVMLDCCFSGAFAEGMTAKDDGRVDVQHQLGGEGRAVLTSSTSTQYAFEEHQADLSIYTRYLIEGIESGAADQDGDGAIAVDELHDYAKRKVQEAAPAMKPGIFSTKEGFKIRVAQARVGDPKLRYRREVERFVERGEISTIARLALDTRRKAWGLTSEDAEAIENEVLKPSRNYRQNLRQYEQQYLEALLREEVLSDETHTDLKYLQQALGLRDEDVAPIEARLMARPMAAAMPPAGRPGLGLAPESRATISPVATLRTPPTPAPTPLVPSQESTQPGSPDWRRVLITATLLLGIGSVSALVWRYDLSSRLTLQAAIARQTRQDYQGCIETIGAIPSYSFHYQRAMQVLDACQQSQVANWLTEAKQRAATGDYRAAIAQIVMIPADSGAYAEAETLLHEWSDQLIQQATAQFDQGDLDEAIATLGAVPEMSDRHADVEQLIADWQRVTADNEAHWQSIQTKMEQFWDWWGAQAEAGEIQQVSTFWAERAKTVIDRTKAEIGKIDAEQGRRAAEIRQREAEQRAREAREREQQERNARIEQCNRYKAEYDSNVGGTVSTVDASPGDAIRRECAELGIEIAPRSPSSSSSAPETGTHTRIGIEFERSRMPSPIRVP